MFILMCIFVAVIGLKIVGVPGVKDIPWSYFLIIPLVWITLRLLWPVFKVVGGIIIFLFLFETFLWVFIPDYHFQIFHIIGSFFSAMWNAIIR